MADKNSIPENTSSIKDTENSDINLGKINDSLELLKIIPGEVDTNSKDENLNKDQSVSTSKIPFKKVNCEEYNRKTIDIKEQKPDDKNIVTETELKSKKKLSLNKNGSDAEFEVIYLIDSPEIKKEQLNTKISKELDQSDEIITIDLVSDDEEDYTSYLSRILATHEIKVYSPGTNLQRSKTSSIENIPKLYISPCKSPGPHLSPKDNCSLNNSMMSPMRILSLRNRTVDITPSPKKSPRNLSITPHKTSIQLKFHIDGKENSPRVVKTASPICVSFLQNESTDITVSPGKSTPKKLHPTPRKTPIQLKLHLDPKENTTAMLDVGSPIRVLSLRNRKVGITPSPKKLTPLRRKLEGSPRI